MSSVNWSSVTEISLAVIGFLLLLALDFILVAARLSYSLAHPTRLIARREVLGARVNQAWLLVSVFPRLRVVLDLLLSITLFLIAGLILSFTFLDVLISHYIKHDVYAQFFGTLAIFSCCFILQRRELKYYLLLI